MMHRKRYRYDSDATNLNEWSSMIRSKNDDSNRIIRDLKYISPGAISPSI